MAVLIVEDFNGLFLLSSPCCSTSLAFRRGRKMELPSTLFLFSRNEIVDTFWTTITRLRLWRVIDGENFCARKTTSFRVFVWNDTIKRGRISFTIGSVNAIRYSWEFLQKKKRKGKNWWSKACRGLEFRFWGFINGEEGKFIPPLFRSRRSSGRSNFHTVSFPRKQNSSHSNV